MNEFVFETKQGDRLIGIAIKPKGEHFFTSLDGVTIFRTRLNRITYLSHEEIVHIRPVTVFDNEYDTALGIGI